MKKKVQARETCDNRVWYVAILMFVLGTIGFIFTIMNYHRLVPTNEWVPCQGLIKVAQEYRYLTESKWGSRLVYGLNIGYGYYVNHKRYNNRIIDLYKLETQDYHQFVSWKSRYTPGSNITVYYNPKHPSDSEIFIDNSKTVIVITGIFWLVIGLAMAVILFMGMRNQRLKQSNVID